MKIDRQNPSCLDELLALPLTVGATIGLVALGARLPNIEAVYFSYQGPCVILGIVISVIAYLLHKPWVVAGVAVVGLAAWPFFAMTDWEVSLFLWLGVTCGIASFPIVARLISRITSKLGFWKKRSGC